jgi:predicted permease
MTPGDARRLAEQRFGDVQNASDRCVDIQNEHARVTTRLHLGAALRQDVVFAARVLRRQALPTTVAAVCIALGIGATTAMFSIGNTMLLRPLPYPNGDRLVSIGSARNGGRAAGTTVSSLADFADWTTRQHSFTNVAASGASSYTVASGQPVRATGAAVTINLFATLGATAAAGRLFSPDDDIPGAPATAIVSAGFADRHLGGSSTIVGQRIRIAGARRTIIGVLPDRWSYPAGTEIWLPLHVDPLRASRRSRSLEVIAELRAGVTPEAANRDMHTLGVALAREYPEADGLIVPFIEPLREHFVGSARPSLIALAVATTLILIVACANVAALQLARVSARSREIAVRAAIGAGRGRIITGLLVENVLLGLCGAVVGIMLAFWTRNIVARAVAANAPKWMTFDIDLRAMLFATLVSVVAAVLFGLAPAIRLTSLDAVATLHGGSATMDRGSARIQRAFVIVELALSVVLVIGATLAVRSVIALRNVPLGFDAQRVETFRISMQGQRYDDASERARVVAALRDGLRILPDVENAAATTYAPVASCCSQFGTTIEGQPTVPGKEYVFTGNIVTPGFFSTMGIRMLGGRDFSADDHADAPHVVIISESFARRFWPAGDAIGHRIDTGGGMGTIIAVVGDIKQGRLVDKPEPQFYRPYAQDPWASMSVVVRTRGNDSTHLAGEVRALARDLDPIALPIARVVTMQRILDDATASNRVLGELLALFAGVALVLAAIGIYAIMSFFVSRRTRELGVRMALGATSPAVLRMVLRQSATLALVGGALGLAGGVAAARALSNTLYGVSATEPAIYVIASVTLVLATIAASVGPARRAGAVDPLVALRAE